MKQLIVFLSLLSFILFSPKSAAAVDNEAGSAGSLTSFAPLLVDYRVIRLKSFLKTYNSPLVDHAVTFIREADKHNLDWRLVAAIAGTESTFGKHIPQGSYNAWGWGIPTGAQSGIGFDNWDHGIATVTQGLKERYVNKGSTTIPQIGRIYAASPVWANHVEFFFDKITNYIPNDLEDLQVSI